MTDARSPLDLAAVTMPLKAITIEGALYAWQDGDPAWVGEWAFPPNGWSDADKASWTGTQGHLIAVKREHDATLAEGDAYATSAAFLIANAQAEVEATIRQKEIDARRLDGAKAWTTARKQYGVNVRAIPCVTGDVVIMVGMSAKEAEAANAAANLAKDQRLAADSSPAGRAIAFSDYLGTHREWMLGKCVWPEKDRIREIADKNFALWDELTEARNDMSRARVADEGKGFAP